jgi:hypothetical protein
VACSLRKRCNSGRSKSNIGKQPDTCDAVQLLLHACMRDNLKEESVSGAEPPGSCEHTGCRLLLNMCGAPLHIPCNMENISSNCDSAARLHDHVCPAMLQWTLTGKPLSAVMQDCASVVSMCAPGNRVPACAKGLKHLPTTRGAQQLASSICEQMPTVPGCGRWVWGRGKSQGEWDGDRGRSAGLP